MAGFENISAQQIPSIKISSNKHYFQTADGKPFFWLGDTGWLLFIKCSREETLRYLDARKQQGFNVIQVMILHSLAAKNIYGAEALENGNISKPRTTAGNHFDNRVAYDYWDHIDFVVQEAAKRGMYMALVPVWGGNVKDGKVSVTQAKAYAKFLAERYKKFTNIIWLNGGDIPGDEHKEVWIAIGETLKKYDPVHLITFHPRGRYISSDWFQNQPWLDFNMIQSGHRNYAQDTSAKEKHHFGEDNWRYVKMDWSLHPVKPVLDGEPSYEKIPQGLHDSLQPRWTDADIRRYAYWSVFAGAAGFTYGNNAVMQFYNINDGRGAFGVRENWTDELTAPGALQMQYLKNLMLRYDYFSRIPAQEIFVNNNGKGHNYILATKGKGFAMVYTYAASSFKIYVSKLGFKCKAGTWFNPVTGVEHKAQIAVTDSVLNFVTPQKREKEQGADWVLILK